MNELLRAQERSANTPNPFGHPISSEPRARSGRRSRRVFDEPGKKPKTKEPLLEPATNSEAVNSVQNENPFKGINPDDAKLKKVSAKVRIRVKLMSDDEYFFVVGAGNKLPHDKAVDVIEGWDKCQPPTDKQLYGLISGAMRARVSEQHLNDLFDRINKKWKSCTKSILKEVREAIQLCLDFDGLKKDNEPGKRIESVCNITEASFKDLKIAILEGLRETHAKEPSAFRCGTEIAQVHHLPEEDSVSINILNKDGFRAVINDCCDFEKSKQDGSTQGCSVPMDIVSDLYSDNKMPLPLPYLRNISTNPVFDETLNLIAADGYHPSAYLYLKLPKGLNIPEVDKQPSENEVAEALRLLIDEYLADFPFDGYSRREILMACGIEPADPNEAAKPVPPSLLSFLAYLLQPLVRPVIGKSPMPALLVTKPAAGSGATKLVDTAQLIISGHTSTRAAMPSNEEERRKSVFSALLGGAAFISFDNVTGPIDSPVLAALLTSVTFTDRVLGKSLERSIPNTASVSMTGNNPNFTKELLRRISLCRLDAGVAEPDKRTDFRHQDLEGWVIANRGRLLWALCTLVTHWKSKGCPDPQGIPLASFGPWFKVCGGILETAGLGGFQANRHELDQVAGGDEEDAIRELVIQWFENATNPNTKFGLVDQYVGGEYGLAALADSAELSLDGVRRKKVDHEVNYDPTSLGRLLAKHADRVFNIGDEVEVLLHVGQKTKHGKPWSLNVLKTAHD